MFNFCFSFADVRSDFVSRLYAIAYTLASNFCSESGTAVLQLPPGPAVDWPEVKDFNLEALGFEQLLRSLYRFAAYGEQSCGFGDPDDFDKDFGRVATVLQLSEAHAVQSRGAWLEGDKGVVIGGKALATMLELASARLTLDAGRSPLTIDQVALLADVDGRTARNAMYLDGPARLIGSKAASGEFLVRSTDALRWLSRRSSFAPTVWVGREVQTLPSHPLAPSAVPSFLRSRIEAVFPDTAEWPQRMDWMSDMSRPEPTVVPGSGVDRISAHLGWTDGRLGRALGGDLAALSASDVHQLALTFHIDGSWLMDQFTRAVSTAVVLSMQGEVGQDLIGETTEFDDVRKLLVVRLTEAGVNNGYLDIEMRHAERLFPKDCFGGRAGDALGQTINLTFDGKTVSTDLRIKSKAYASPRKRFNGWFRTTGAKAGDRVRIQQVGPRGYELTLLKEEAARTAKVTQ